MKDFGQWFNDAAPAPAAKPEPVKNFGDWGAALIEQQIAEHGADTRIYLTCRGCGKTEQVRLGDLLSGDAWAVYEDDESGTGLCGGSVFCTP